MSQLFTSGGQSIGASPNPTKKKNFGPKKYSQQNIQEAG